MNSYKTIIVAIFLIAFQVLVFNSINLFGVIPYPYVLLILLLPLHHYSYQHLVLAFLVGAMVDIFSDSSGIQTASFLIVAYAQPFILNRFFVHIINKGHLDFRDKVCVYYLTMIVVVHHFFLYTFIIFDFHNIIDIIYLTLKGSVLTLLFCLMLIPFYKNAIERIH